MTTARKSEMARVLKAAGATYQEIAELFNLSYQRIQQLVAGTRTTRRLSGKCQKCKRKHDHLHRHHTNYDTLKIVLLCPSCHGKTKKLRTGIWTRKNLIVVKDDGTFGAKLKIWRGGRTQFEVSSLLKIPIATYRKYEYKDRTPNKLALAELERRMERTAQ